MILSVASGGLSPRLARSFVAPIALSPQATTGFSLVRHNVLRPRSLATTASSSTAHAGNSLRSRPCTTAYSSTGRWLGSISGRAHGRRHRRYVGHLAAGEDGGGTGSGRVSAAVLQDADGRRSEGGAAARKQQRAEMLDLKPPKGTRDVFPEDMRLRNW